MLQTEKWKEYLAPIESFLCDKKELLLEGLHKEVELFAVQIMSAAIQWDQFQTRVDFQKENPENIPISACLKFNLGLSKLLKGNNKAADLVAHSKVRVAKIQNKLKEDIVAMQLLEFEVSKGHLVELFIDLGIKVAELWVVHYRTFYCPFDMKNIVRIDDDLAVMAAYHTFFSTMQPLDQKSNLTDFGITSK
eukprot:736974-Ditylum_brightwellii.AAC.1